MKTSNTILTFALVAIFALVSSAKADVTIGDFATLGDTFDFEIAQQSAAGLFRTNNGNGSDVPAIFGSGNAIGNTFQGVPVLSTQDFTDLGGGDFELQLRVTSGGNLAAANISGNAITAVRFTIGAGFIGGDALAVLPHTVSFAEIATFDQNGAVIASENALGLPVFNTGSFLGTINTNLEGGQLGAFTAVGTDDRVAEARVTIRGNIAIPEPTSAALLCGISFVGLVSRRRRS